MPPSATSDGVLAKRGHGWAFAWASCSFTCAGQAAIFAPIADASIERQSSSLRLGKRIATSQEHRRQERVELALEHRLDRQGARQRERLARQRACAIVTHGAHR